LNIEGGNHNEYKFCSHKETNNLCVSKIKLTIVSLSAPTTTMSLNDIQLTDFIVAEWYKKDTLLPLATGPLAKGPAPAISSAPPIAPPQSKPASSATPSATAPPPPAPTPPKAPAPENPQSPGAPYKYLGNNRRHIALLVHSPGSGFLPDNQLAFLTKILEACRMTLADIAIVNNAAVPVTITELRQQLQPKTVLLFGVDPTAIKLPINFPHFKQLNYDDCTYLSSPALDQLVPNTEDSKLLKSKLWVSLKTLFDV
jgi:hypothetical protein